MSANKNYLQCFSEFLKKNEINSGNSPLDYMEKWNELLEDALEGYSYSLYEFDFEITIRDDIQAVIDSLVFDSFCEYGLFLKEIERIDTKMREIVLIKGDKYWWRNCILKFAGPQYAENVLIEHKIGIRVVE